jgi:hypothetical protein
MAQLLACDTWGLGLDSFAWACWQRAKAAERERCAKLAESFTDPCDGPDSAMDTQLVASCIAARIREA